MTAFVGALDQGTTSTRFLIFDADGREVARHQLEHRQILPKPGWVEHDPDEIIAATNATIAGALAAARLTGDHLAAIAVTNQRETTVVWDPATGRPWYNAIVWQDTRTAPVLPALEPHRAALRDRTGLPPSTYFSASKLAWVLDHVSGVRSAAESGRALFGTIDSWIVWHLTGGAGIGRHVTDVTNASRTQLVNLRTLDWDDALLTLFRIPRAMLPAIASPTRASASRTPFGTTTRTGPVGAEVPITAVLGDQHAALIGQTCFDAGDVKNTYGTGNFLLLNTGAQIVPSAAGLLTTVGYALGHAAAVYALEGSVAVTGSAVQWLRDQLGVIAAAAEVEPLAASVPDSAGVYFVPAFSGLFAPYWRPDARGIITGLARFHTKAHLARATLEAICFQSRAVIDAMTADAGVRPPVLKVDGGATRNDLLMQLQADILGIPVMRPIVNEITALGAAYAAGLAAGVWPSVAVLRAQWRADRTWEPTWTADRRDAAFHRWNRAVSLAIDVEAAGGDGPATPAAASVPSPLR